MKNRFYTNIDINSVVTPFLNRVSEEENVGEELLYPFVEIYKDTLITDVLLNIFCQYSAAKSEIWSDYADKYEQENENGAEVDYKDLYKGIYKLNSEYSIDPYEVWLRRLRQIGLSGWLTIRMNDCHEPDEQASFLRSDFFYEAREKGWVIGDKYGYFRYCFDYSVPEVRKKMLDYIKEQLWRYDPDGLELDFQREITCFDIENCTDRVEIMTDFVRAVREMTEERGKQLGHKIRLGVRLMPDIAQNLIYGFDIVNWAKDGLVDLVCFTPRWETSDSDMPSEEWKAKIKGVELAAGIEILCCLTSDETYCTPAVARGYAVRYLSRGADSMYLFNYFINPDSVSAAMDEVNKTAGSLETAMKLPYRHVVTFQDIAPRGHSRRKPLPINLKSGQSAALDIDIGKSRENASAELIIGFTAGSPESVAVSVNGAAAAFEKTEYSSAEPERIIKYGPEGTVYYKSPVKPADRYRVEFKAGGEAEITYAEIGIF
ncbi:MAG: hypothetical protein GX827_05640 [Clostridiales bacterium]|nr:hypothetical protein [Clostridiales bacterium]